MLPLCLNRTSRILLSDLLLLIVFVLMVLMVQPLMGWIYSISAIREEQQLERRSMKDRQRGKVASLVLRSLPHFSKREYSTIIFRNVLPPCLKNIKVMQSCRAFGLSLFFSAMLHVVVMPRMRCLSSIRQKQRREREAAPRRNFVCKGQGWHWIERRALLVPRTLAAVCSSLSGL